MFAKDSEDIFISAGYDSMMKLWDIRMENSLITSREHDSTIEGIAFGQSKDQVIIAHGNCCSIWDIRKSFGDVPLLTLQPHLKPILTISYDKAQNRIITGAADSMLKFIDPIVFLYISLVWEIIVFIKDGISAYCI